jgi:PIN domain nuclease of toxin-antitoxin system
MRLLLDTHVILWWYFDSSRLSREHIRLIADETNEVYVSAASIWEIEVKRRNGKLKCPVDMLERIKADGFSILPIMAEHLVPLRTIPNIHNDPFDRILVCQSLVEKIPLISYDEKVKAYFA